MNTGRFLMVIPLPSGKPPFAVQLNNNNNNTKKVVGLERGPLSLMSTTEDLLDRKVAAPVYKTENTAIGIRHADHVAPSIRRS
jgi:hypothetical protein